MEELNGEDEVQDKPQKRVAKHDGGVADLERVTDYAEEREIQFNNISNVSEVMFWGPENQYPFFLFL